MSGIKTPLTDNDSTVEAEEVNLTMNSSLEGLQSDEQRRILDTVDQVRKCGLEGVLSLPQLVVCGAQSAGKSSVLEALTEIPFPRNENLCTRYATEIVLRRATLDSLNIKVLPHVNRSSSEQDMIKAFSETITNFDDLPCIMGEAMKVMGISNDSSDGNSQAFSNDVLSITIEGPNRPQLTLVDIPGLIGTATKGVTDQDVELVAEITERYIAQPRTICLAVVSGAADHATQSILKKVREVDPRGERTLGIITKPDRIEGVGSKKAFLDLARNEDIYLGQGWHVVKNRGPGDNCSNAERKAAEMKWFRNDPIFKALPSSLVGTDALRLRLSTLLFEHVKRELPQLREDLENLLDESQSDLKILGIRRSSVAECKEYLSQLSSEFHDVCSAAVNGHYDRIYFRKQFGASTRFDISSPSTICRTRAVVQSMNAEFSHTLHTKGQKYIIDMKDEGDDDVEDGDDVEANGQVLTNGMRDLPSPLPQNQKKGRGEPVRLNKKEAINWVREQLVLTRGKELPGNFNPHLIVELFWDQSSRWGYLAAAHIDRIAEVCSSFLRSLLADKCPSDVQPRIWQSITKKLKVRKLNADKELELLLEDLRNHPINYNHYYTDTIAKSRQDRQKLALIKCVSAATETDYDTDYENKTTQVNIDKAVTLYAETTETDMEKFSCEEVLDCLFAIYKVTQKTFIANVTTQVVERHIVRGLETIFCPLVVNRLSDAETESLASEPLDTKRERARLEVKIQKLKDGHEAFKSAMGFTLR